MQIKRLQHRLGNGCYMRRYKDEMGPRMLKHLAHSSGLARQHSLARTGHTYLASYVVIWCFTMAHLTGHAPKKVPGFMQSDQDETSKPRSKGICSA